jgi:hypothetical protein
MYLSKNSQKIKRSYLHGIIIIDLDKLPIETTQQLRYSNKMTTTTTLTEEREYMIC